MEIRIATEKDLSIVREIAFVTWPVTYGTILSQDQLDYMLHLIYSLDALTIQMKEKKHCFLFAQDASGILGFASYSIENSLGRLHKLYVLPSAQGKKVGTDLLSFIEREASKAGCAHMQLNVNRYNDALHFYKQKGYSILFEEDIPIGKSYSMNDYRLEKRL